MRERACVAPEWNGFWESAVGMSSLECAAGGGHLRAGTSGWRGGPESRHPIPVTHTHDICVIAPSHCIMNHTVTLCVHPLITLLNHTCYTIALVVHDTMSTHNHTHTHVVHSVVSHVHIWSPSAVTNKRESRERKSCTSYITTRHTSLWLHLPTAMTRPFYDRHTYSTPTLATTHHTGRHTVPYSTTQYSTELRLRVHIPHTQGGGALGPRGTDHPPSYLLPSPASNSVLLTGQVVAGSTVQAVRHKRTGRTGIREQAKWPSRLAQAQGPPFPPAQK